MWLAVQTVAASKADPLPAVEALPMAPQQELAWVPEALRLLLELRSVLVQRALVGLPMAVAPGLPARLRSRRCRPRPLVW